MGETLSEYDKWHIILKLGISAFLASQNPKNYFPTLTAGFVGVGHKFKYAGKENVYTCAGILLIEAWYIHCFNNLSWSF